MLDTSDIQERAIEMALHECLQTEGGRRLVEIYGVVGAKLRFMNHAKFRELACQCVTLIRLADELKHGDA